MSASPAEDTGPRPERGRRAIVVGLDASPLSVSGLRMAAVVARRWGVRVEAVHVEDAAVARLSSHPGVVTVCGLTARSRPLALAPETITAALSAQARAARDAVEAAKALLRRRAGEGGEAELVFRSRRGGVTRELRAVADEAAPSLLVVGWTGQSRARWHRAHGIRLGSTARALVQDPSADRVLVVRGELEADAPLLVPFDGSDAARRALDAACTLAEDGPAERVAVLAFGDADALAAAARDICAAHGTVPRVQALPPLTLARLVRIADFPEALLVLPAQLPMTLGLSTPDLIDRLGCSVLLVR
ncbi:hypothetical protein C882_3146 [Caenispirillum salinarum AK4]|uniref:UspA domain-containing protein n=1 Tax=Caenispirillum salinarum AK4 TaxID=1238182 RepID=K9H3F2_9PROT|nr:universal stress protein [Caenispirillum salinarum]EKV32082.1 hypothetical protein C882_3146 [Caenispirillum salinarum AK4]